MTESTTLPNYSGNGALFSFACSILNAVKQGQIPEATARQLLQNWGSYLSVHIEWTGRLGQDLDAIAALLRVLGLVRVFEPYANTGETRQILVMRCLFTRYISASPRHTGLPPIRLVPDLVTGLLQAGGHMYTLEEEPNEHLRSDEYILTLRPVTAPKQSLSSTASRDSTQAPLLEEGRYLVPKLGSVEFLGPKGEES